MNRTEFLSVVFSADTCISFVTRIKMYRTIMLPVFCTALTLNEERRLRVFENRVLRRIFGPKRDEMTGECRKLQNDELNDLYSSPNMNRAIK